MRRIVSIVLAAAILCLALTACGSRQKTDLSKATTIADLKGAVIAGQAGTFHLDVIDQIDGVEKKSYPDFTDLLNALKSGAIDGYVAEEPTALEVCGKDDTLTYLPFVNNDTGFTATDAETGIAVAFQTGSPMVATVNDILATIPTETRQALMAQMVSLSADPDTQSSDAIVLQSSNTDTSNGVFRIAMECAYAPFNWTQTTDANGAVPISGKDNLYASGYDVQVAKYIAAELGMSLEVYSYEWDSLIAAVQSGAVDAIIAGMTATPERRENVDFTDPYYESKMVVIVRKDSDLTNITSIQDLSGRKVQGQLNTLYDTVIDQIEGVDHVTPLATYPLMVVALQSGEVDALTAELPVAAGVVASNPDLTYVEFAEGSGFEADTSVSIAVKKGNTALLDAIQSALASVSEEDRQQWMIDATSRQPAQE